jgi:signal transduction histidine kinase
LFAATPLFIVCAITGGYFLSRRALLPVSLIAEKAKGIGVTNLSERLTVSQTRDELQSLTETWNGMLDRLELSITKISRFTADASHELRTPVAIIRLSAESVLRKLRSDAEYRMALHKIQRESENMTRLIDDLLFLARADVDENPCSTELINLSTLIGEVAADFRPIAESNGITLSESAPEAHLFVKGNSSDLRRLFITLLDNAVKYTFSGGTVQLHAMREDGEAVAQVEDTGIGIPDGAQAHVFERFYRVDSSRSKESGGYGLGLAIAAAIVQQHNGSINVMSRPGGGSIFVVRLPFSPEPADRMAECASHLRLNQRA